MMTRLPEGRPMRSYAQRRVLRHRRHHRPRPRFPCRGPRRPRPPWFLYVAYQAAHFPLQSRPERHAGLRRDLRPGLGQGPRSSGSHGRRRSGSLRGRAFPDAAKPDPDAGGRPCATARITADGNNPPWDSLPAGPPCRPGAAHGRLCRHGDGHGPQHRPARRRPARAWRNGEHAHHLPQRQRRLRRVGAVRLRSSAGRQVPSRARASTSARPCAANILHRGDALASMGGPGSLFSYGSGWANASNTPFRFYKHYDHEGGISTPLIVHWPAGTKRQGEFEQSCRSRHRLDGDLRGRRRRDLSANLRRQRRSCPWKAAVCCRPCGEKPQPRMLFWEHEGNRAVRDGKWKLVGAQGRAVGTL